jgi:hypothetical protein
MLMSKMDAPSPTLDVHRSCSYSQIYLKKGYNQFIVFFSQIKPKPFFFDIYLFSKVFLLSIFSWNLNSLF